MFATTQILLNGFLVIRNSLKDLLRNVFHYCSVVKQTFDYGLWIAFVYLVAGAIGDQIQKTEKLLLEHEDVCQRVELEKSKLMEKIELSRLVEKRQ